jgi:hypothetical protein
MSQTSERIINAFEVLKMNAAKTAKHNLIFNKAAYLFNEFIYIFLRQGLIM